MRRGLAHAGAWTLATSAAVAMSWFGVHHVLAGTAYDPPRALPLAEPAAASAPPPPSSPPPSAPSDSASRRRESPARPPAATDPGTPPAVKPSVSAPARPPGTPTPASSATGNVHSYPVEGGRVVLDLGDTSATLVSATPEAGWEMKVWNESASAWIRVDFTSGGTTSSLFCTWNGHPPTVETYTAGGR
ncbi:MULTISPECIES: hypothetical protein [unclassified Streptomyces]|uniref:hypothetical protein n=1 Tax=unclassified Streptomyces TaxID=2593676 RepID=UPI003811E003